MFEKAERRLAAILAADVVGYSKLMGDDETGTLAALRELRRDLLAPAVQQHRGNLIKSMGDGWLVEFPSAADGVACALQLQEVLSGHASIKLRVGLHVGDVTFEDEDIFGDGVNVAARLQELAEPGAVVISDMAWRSIDGKQSADFADLGTQDLKNIANPVTAYGWGMTAVATAATVLPLPDKPSIAVLPFNNMSGDPEQEYFSDGISEDIITGLSKIPHLFVIARNSTFSYKGKPVTVTEVARELGVHYVLEGSVRKAGNRLRITAQLIDGIGGDHIWAEKYDRNLEDIFDLQDEITLNVITSTRVPILSNTAMKTEKRSATDLSIWDLIVRAGHFLHQFTPEGIAEARRLAGEILERDPESAVAMMMIANYLSHEAFLGYSNDPMQSLRTALDIVKRSLEIFEGDAQAHWVKGNLDMYFLHQPEVALDEYRRSLELNPNHHLALANLGVAEAFIGDPDKGIGCIERSLRANPRDPAIFFRFGELAICHFIAGRYEEAVKMGDKGLMHRSSYKSAHLIKAICQAHLGQIEAAHETLAIWRDLSPNATIATVYKPPFRKPEDLERYCEGLRLAGLPEV